MGSLKIRNNTSKGYLEAKYGDGVDLTNPKSKTRRGRVQSQRIHTLDTSAGRSKGIITKDLRIRKLTPRECGRLMGVSDDDITKLLSVSSDTQAFKQFGNSIVVDVMYYIFKQMMI